MRRFHGKYLGWCVDNNDPRMVGRLRVRLPYPFDNEVSTWALPCLPPGTFTVPAEGQGVWVEFVQGDPNQPVWVGVWYGGVGDDATHPTQAPFQAVHAPLTDFTGADAEPDREHTAAVDEVDDVEHREFHDHRTTFYTPHVFSQVSHTGHHLLWDDHPGKEGRVQLFERFGRMLEFTARGLTKLRSYVTPSFADATGATGPASHRLVFADGLNDPDGSDPDAVAGQYVSLKDMAGAELRMESTAGQQQVTVRDAWGQSITLDTKHKNIVAADANGNTITLTQGKVVLGVAASSKVYVGGEGGQQLATKTFVQAYYNAHTHVSSAPGTPTSPPILLAPLTAGQDLTKKTIAE